MESKKMTRCKSYGIALCALQLLAALVLLQPRAVLAGGPTVGDYVQFGSYSSEPVLWRIINNNADGSYMLLAENVLSLKAFDANGDLSGDRGDLLRTERGSNYWQTSSLREWLNSEAATVSYTQQAPDAAHVAGGQNAYAADAGFLYDFAPGEVAAIQPTAQKSVLATVDALDGTNYLDAPYSGVKDSGTEEHIYNSSYLNLLQNFEAAYSKSVTDRVFLLDVREWHDYVRYNSSLGGAETDESRTGRKPTQQAIDACSPAIVDAGLSTTQNWAYWLRTPYAASSYGVRVAAGAVTEYQAQYGTFGVVPALNLKSGITVASGGGTAGSPYVLADYVTTTTTSVSTTTTSATTTTTIGGGADTDGDGTPNATDNCPAIANPQQLDADDDDIGDACDTTPGCGGCGQPVCEGLADSDGDYVLDINDNCPDICNYYQLDADDDGIGDACDTGFAGCAWGTAACGLPVCEEACR